MKKQAKLKNGLRHVLRVLAREPRVAACKASAWSQTSAWRRAWARSEDRRFSEPLVWYTVYGWF